MDWPRTWPPSLEARNLPRYQKGRKNDFGKPQWGLLLRDLVQEVADVVAVLTFGAKKYRARNWQLVTEGPERYLDALDRHMAAIAQGQWLDPETKLPHYAHALCSLFFAFWHSRRAR